MIVQHLKLDVGKKGVTWCKMGNYSRKTQRDMIVEMHKDIQHIKDKICDIKPMVTANTEFRLKATGVFSIVAIISGFVGSFSLWIIGRFFNK